MRVGVVIPVRDGEAFLAPTIRSALHQTHAPHEIIVVDNGSRDRSAAVAESFGASVRLVREPRPGAAAARATGAAQAQSDALMFLDADDLLGPDAIAALVAALEARPWAVACCPWRRYEQVGAGWHVAPASCAPRASGQDPLDAWLRGWYHPPCAVLWSRKAYERSGGWDPEITVNDDGDLMMRALVAGVPLVETSRGCAYYRRLPDAGASLSAQRLTPRGVLASLAVLDRLERLLREAGRLERHAPALRDAYRRVAADCPTDAADLRTRACDAARSLGGDRAPRIPKMLSRTAARLRRPSRPVRSGVRFDLAPDLPDGASRPDPLVSVIIPTYNRAHIVSRALDSALAQTYRNIEVLVVDDGSTDETQAVVEARGDERVRWLPQPQNAGVAAARNRGMREARGELIGFLDSDDAWVPEKLARQIDLVRRRPSRVGFFFTGTLSLHADGSQTIWRPADRGDVLPRILASNIVHVATSSVILRREVIDAVGGFDESMPANEDYDLWSRIARFYEFDHVSELLTLHGDDIPVTASAGRRSQNFEANMRARQIHLDRFGDDMVDWGAKQRFHLDCARRHLRSPFGSAWRARLHLLKAVRAAPGEPRLAAWLGFSLLPRTVRRGLGPAFTAARRRLPDRLWFGEGRTDRG